MTATTVALLFLLTMPFRMSGMGACGSVLGGETIGIDHHMPQFALLPVHEGDVRALIAELARRRMVVKVPADWPDLADRSAPAAEAPGEACAPQRSR